MFALRSLFLFALLLAIFSAVARSETTRDEVAKDNSADYAAFQQLLAEVDESSIHSALHRWSNKFRDGIFSKDRTAIEAVHSENPKLATKLVYLAKRASNSTVTTSHKTSSKSSAATTSESAAASSAAATSTPAETSLSGAVLTTTDSEGSSVASTVSGGVSTLSSGQSTFERVSSTVVSTKTLPNGQQSTITGITIVNAPNTAGPTPSGSAGASVSATGSGSPGLQNGAASASMGLKKELFAMMGGAVAVAMALQ